MARFVEISDAGDERLTDYVRLRDVSLRRRLETEHGLFIAEGEKIIHRAWQAGYRPRSLLLAPRWVDGLRELIDASDIDVYLVDESMAERITGFHVHRGALGSFERQPPRPMSALLEARRLVVCEDIVDHTNVGAIIRCAAGLGWDGVLLAPRAADPLYRRAIKTGMGAVFSLPWARMDDWAHDLDRLREGGFTVAAMALRDDSLTLTELVGRLREHPGKLALLMGTEGSGLSSHWIGQADVVVRIPMARGIDSLNVAAAAAIACYALAE
ncbi:TrmH family RNA methyltransferase [Propionibacterium sp.]|uniref:TrmH family RNA methyltransferase n=1 Tax=Propionibacterium sp. TaxID=1977903 RepID=UPI0039EA02D6